MSKGPPPQRLSSPGHSGFPTLDVRARAAPHAGRSVTLHQALGHGLCASTSANSGDDGRLSAEPCGRALPESGWPAEEDDLLRSQYPIGKKAAIAAISEIQARHPSLTRREIASRARTLGLRCIEDVRRRGWDRGADLALLSLAHQPKEIIARRLGRSVESILARLRRLGKSADFFGGFKAKELAGVLKITETDVRRWQRNGWLRRRRGRITEASFSAFCKEHPEEIPFGGLAPETQFWLVSVHGYPKCSPMAMAAGAKG
jgi:hypothetical protein